MKLYEHPESGNSHKVRLLLSFLGIEYESVVVDLMTDEQHQEPFQSINPRGEVPVLDDDGAILRDSKSESFALTAVKPRAFRGVQSSIVLCSEMELGLSEDHTGVLLLDEKAEPGGLVRDLLEIPADCAADVVFEIDILPNYGRCLSIIGIAREVAALTRTPFKLEIKAEHLPTDPEAFKVSIEDPGLAPRYSGLVLEDVKVEPSPAWMQRRLALAGLSPINNLVDVTNYVMVEMGQPMHAFDLDKLPEQEITVRAAREGETLFTLDQEPGGENGEGEKPRELDALRDRTIVVWKPEADRMWTRHQAFSRLLLALPAKVASLAHGLSAARPRAHPDREVCRAHQLRRRAALGAEHPRRPAVAG